MRRDRFLVGYPVSTYGTYQINVPGYELSSLRTGYTGTTVRQFPYLGTVP